MQYRPGMGLASLANIIVLIIMIASFTEASRMFA